MRKLIFVISALCVMFPAFSQSKLNDTPDAILGKYFVVYEDVSGPVRVEKDSNGTYKAYVDDATNVQLVKGLKYNKEKKQWDGAKMRDPRNGLTANCVCRFNDNGVLVVRGQLLGIGKTLYWERRK